MFNISFILFYFWEFLDLFFRFLLQALILLKGLDEAFLPFLLFFVVESVICFLIVELLQSKVFI